MFSISRCPAALYPIAMTVTLGSLAGCSGENAADNDSAESAVAVEVLVTGAAISGANGLHFSPEGSLYVASVLGSELVVLDPQTGKVLDRLSSGIDGPDDIAFNADGDFYWTSILTGEVAGMTAGGERISAAQLMPGVNPLTFSDDGRLFVSQCFFADNLYEVDPRGIDPPRLISDQLGPGCGLNGMDWGPDGRLYGPRWFHQQVVSFDVDTGEMRIEATGFNVPAAVKFDSHGVLHVLDTGAGAVIRVEGMRQSIAASLTPGLDNLAFDVSDRLFVSSFADGAVWRVEDDGSLTTLSPGGMAHPGGLTLLGQGDGLRAVVADLHAIRAFDAVSGDEAFTQRNILGVGDLGSSLTVTADGSNLILTSWTDNNVRVWDPVAERTVVRHDDLFVPVSAVRYAGELVVAEHAAGQVRALGTQSGKVYVSGLPAPTGLLTDGQSLWVSDRARGEVLKIGDNGEPVEPHVVASGLQSPEGLALWRDQILVREGESGRVLRLVDGRGEALLQLGPGGPPASPSQPPSMIFNDIVVDGETLYATDELARQLQRVDLSAL